MTSTEKSNLFRQLLDIQMQADKLIKGSPSEQEVEHFNQYAQELKYYCLENIEQDDIQRLLYEIPEVEMKEDYPGLKLSQYKDKIFQKWKKSPENPANQQ